MDSNSTEKGIDGILVVDKPSGWTSHDVVQKTRNILHVKKVGHTGTLDPMATGVLILLIGRATKSASLFENDDKEYSSEITFGNATDTYDAEGKVTETGDPSAVDPLALHDAILGFTGSIQQIPPMYSAKKVGGKKLYKLARAGKEVERKPQTITIHSISSDITNFPKITVNVSCSKGTYIRSLAHEIGIKVGCPSHMSALRRTRAGKYTLNDAVDFLHYAKSDHSNDIEQWIKPVPETEI